MAQVSLVQNKNITAAVERVINLLGGIKKFVQPGDTVVIKPNLVLGMPPYSGFTTDPPVVQAVIELCQSRNPSNITIAEGSGGIDTALAFRLSGYTELAKKQNVTLKDLNTTSTTKVPIPNGLAVQELHIPNIIRECDVLINLPKLKLYTHPPRRKSWVSLAIKNLLGALPGQGQYTSTRPAGFTLEMSREFWTPNGKYYHPTYQQWWSPRGEKQRIHTNLSQGLIDINMVIHPTLNLIDAIIVNSAVDMTHTTGESAFELNTILASQDPLALDYIATQIAEFNPLDVSYLHHATTRNIGESDPTRIQTLGTPIQQITKTWNTGIMRIPT